MKVTVIPIVIDAPGTVLKDLEKGLEESEIEISQTKALLNTEKSPGNMKRLTVTQTPVKDH